MPSSVVLTGRNDGYKDDARLIACLVHMLDAFDEVILVDWNSRVSLYNILYADIPHTKRLRFINVSAEQAANISPSDVAFFETMARNIGIRRASYDWIASSNLDIIPDTKGEWNQFFNTIPQEHFYIGRKIDIPLNYFYSELNINHLRTSWRRANSYIPYIQESECQIPEMMYSVIHGCGDMQVAHKDIWYKIKAFEESMCYRNYADTQIQIKAAAVGCNLVIFEQPKFWHIQHLSTYTQEQVKFNDVMMLKNSTTTNDDNWGHPEIYFEEIIV